MSAFPFLLAQNIKITNWLTPVWLISLGIAIGFILVLLMLAKIVFCQRISWLNSVTEKPGLRIGLGIVTSIAYLGMFLGFCYWRNGSEMFSDSSMVMPLGFAIPLSLLLGFGVWSLVAKRMQGETIGLFREGFLGWINWICVTMTLFALVGFGLAQVNGFGLLKFVDEPMEMVSSLMRLPFTGEFKATKTIPPCKEGDMGTPVPVNFNGRELQSLAMLSDRSLEMGAKPIMDIPVRERMDLPKSSEALVYRQRADGRGRIPLEDIENLYFANYSKTDASLELSWTIVPVNKEVVIVPMIALAVVALYLFYLILATMCPKVFAIAHSTFKTEVNQPLFLLVMVVGAVFVVGSIYVPYNTFGEDIKMYKDSGLTLIRVLAIFLAIWAASKSVAEEIEGRTALTVLSKPVGRRQFIFGKFTGIAMAIGVMFLLLGLWFVIFTAYKPIYDFQEASKGICEWPECFVESINVIPGIFLCFLEVLIFVAISVAISTRFGILANFLICFAVYVLGHLTPLLVQSSLGAFETVVVFGQLIAIVFPVLNHFDIQAAINTNSAVPMAYIGWSIIYTGLYGSMAMLLALVLFEDRDLA
ncbi:MAG: ABC-type transport system involved in multi-copper enzyme maturation permease subunit [Mariniblastus sp.]|jgi:ABC-type transport system involved in multi-copper enzyme maturation permease subunit